MSDALLGLHMNMLHVVASHVEHARKVESRPVQRLGSGQQEGGNGCGRGDLDLEEARGETFSGSESF
jgi:hypothetical protein